MSERDEMSAWLDSHLEMHRKRIAELEEQVADLRGDVAMKERDCQYHMDAINNLAAYLALTGTSYEVVNAATQNMRRMAAELSDLRLALARQAEKDAEICNLRYINHKNQGNNLLAQESLACCSVIRLAADQSALEEVRKLREIVKCARAAWWEAEQCGADDLAHSKLLTALENAGELPIADEWVTDARSKP